MGTGVVWSGLSSGAIRMELRDLNEAFAGRYLIERQLGEGAAAWVYAALDPRHDRRVAIKVLRPEVSAWLGTERFLREIRIAAGLTHPHIVPLHDSGEVQLRAGPRLLYFVMPFLEGDSLRKRLEGQPQLPLEEALRIAGDVADALDYAHRHNVLHRDIKPENILFLDEGQAAVADFGVARALERRPGEHRTDPGLAIGTPTYMSPEVCGGEGELDGRADEYSLACVLYEMLTGEPPFSAATVRALAARHMFDTVPPLTTVRPDITSGLAAVVNRALAKAPADRYPSLRDFAAALRAAAAGQEVETARSVAVLPFENSGGLPEDQVLSDGITDEIITALARVEGLRVASRTSVFAAGTRGRDVQAIAAQLHVGSVLEGTVRRAGGRLRVSVQLVGARDGYLLWSERFDRTMEDIFAIQDEIAQNVARALRAILREDARPLAPRRTTDLRAYEHYLRGRQYFRQSRRQSLQFAQEMFRRATGLDDHFAAAWAGLAMVSAVLHMYYPDSEADRRLADEASARALALEPGLAEAHTARGAAVWRLGREDEAAAEFETAMRLDARQYDAPYFFARLRFHQGRHEEAAALFEAAARAEEDYQARFFAAQSFAALGRKAEAEAAYRRALRVVQDHLELNPHDGRAATMCAVSLCRLGQPQEGLKWAERAREVDPDEPSVLYNVACLYALEGKADTALDTLEETFRVGFGDPEWIARDPDLESLRDLPRFQALFAAR